MIIPVILCGGAGYRLWPVSTQTIPKQFISQLDAKFGKGSSFEQTICRFDHPNFTPPIIITHTKYISLVTASLDALGISALAIILEPVSNNTAPAIASAAHLVKKLNLEQLSLLFTPADCIIPQGISKNYHL